MPADADIDGGWQSGHVNQATERRTTALGVLLGLTLTGVAAWAVAAIGNRWVADGLRADATGASAAGVTTVEVVLFLLGLFAAVAGVMVVATSILRTRPAEPSLGRLRGRFWPPVLRGAALAALLAVFAGPVAGLVVLLVVVAGSAIASARARRTLPDGAR